MIHMFTWCYNYVIEIERPFTKWTRRNQNDCVDIWIYRHGRMKKWLRPNKESSPFHLLSWTWMASFYISISPISLLTWTTFYSIFHNFNSVSWNKYYAYIVFILLSSTRTLQISILFSWFSIWLHRSYKFLKMGSSWLLWKCVENSSSTS